MKNKYVSILQIDLFSKYTNINEIVETFVDTYFSKCFRKRFERIPCISKKELFTAFLLIFNNL